MPVAIRTRRSSALSFFATAVLTAPIAAFSLAARPVRLVDGLTFHYNVTTTSQDKARRDATNLNAMVRITDGAVRMDYTEGKSPLGKDGGWLLFEGQQFAIINDKDKQAMVMDAATFGSGAGAMLNNPMIRVRMFDLGFSYEDLGAGEPLLGYNTRHLRVINRNTVEVKVLGMTRRNTTVDSSEQWLATGLGLGEEGMLAWARAFGSGIKATSPELAAAIEKYNAEYGRKGMSLKTVTYSTITDQKGKVTRDTVTMLVTDIKKGSLDGSLFKIPAGYEVANIGESLKAAGAARDSAKQADSSSKKAEPKPDAKQALKGLFKKPPQ